MDGACSTCGGEKHIRFCWENLRERDHLEDLGVDYKIILKWIFKSGMEGHELDLSG